MRLLIRQAVDKNTGEIRSSTPIFYIYLEYKFSENDYQNSIKELKKTMISIKLPVKCMTIYLVNQINILIFVISKLKQKQIENI